MNGELSLTRIFDAPLALVWQAWPSERIDKEN